MSKYIKLEDAIHNINLEVTGRKEYTGDMKANLFFALDDLPTIEVSEDCISREVAIDIIKNYDFKFPQYMERFVNELREAIKKDLVEDIRNAPSVVPTVRKNRQVERAEGEWLLDGRCSECLVSPLTTHKNYCPNCGADMRGKQDG